MMVRFTGRKLQIFLYSIFLIIQVQNASSKSYEEDDLDAVESINTYEKVLPPPKHSFQGNPLHSHSSHSQQQQQQQAEHRTIGMQERSRHNPHLIHSDESGQSSDSMNLPLEHQPAPQPQPPQHHSRHNLKHKQQHPSSQLSSRRSHISGINSHNNIGHPHPGLAHLGPEGRDDLIIDMKPPSPPGPPGKIEVPKELPRVSLRHDAPLIFGSSHMECRKCGGYVTGQNGSCCDSCGTLGYKGCWCRSCDCLCYN